MKLTGAQILIETLVENGVDTVFGYPGGSVLNIYDELYKNSARIRSITTSHEQGAAHAADGYARATGKVGVVLSTSGPGATNLVTGIATAYMDSVPLIAITGNVSTDLLGLDSFQEVYIAGITMPITKHNVVVRNVEDLADAVREAFRVAIEGRPGPVLIDIPKDITSAKCEFTKKRPEKPQKMPGADEITLHSVAKRINRSKRPLLFVGGGTIISGCEKELLAFMQKTDIPACHTMMGIGAIPADNPLNLGMVGMHGKVSGSLAVDDADLILAVGTRFSDRTATDKNRFARKADIVQFDIDASELGKNIALNDMVVGDLKDTLSRLLPMVSEKTHPEWLDKIRVWQETRDYTPLPAVDHLTPEYAISMLAEMAGPDMVFTTDVGQHQMWAAQYSHRSKPRTFLTSGGLGTMGYGYGAAIGAAVAHPGNHVVMITGDGSFHMNMNETATAVTYGFPIITVIMDNHVLGMVRQWQTTFYEGRYSSTSIDKKTNYVKLAEAFGAVGFRVTTPAQLRTAMEQALTINGPVIIDCEIGCDERVLPMIPPGKTIDDVIDK